MPIEAALTFAWTAVYAYLALFYFALFLRRRTDAVYRAFAALALCMAVLSWGSTRLYAATSAEGRMAGLSIVHLGYFPGSIASMEFALRILGRPIPRWFWVGVAWSAVGLVAALLDRTVAVLPGDGGLPDATISLVGALLFALGTPWAATNVVVLGRAARENPAAKRLFVAQVIGVIAGLLDVFRLRLGWFGFDVLPHVGIGTHVVVSHVLLVRFVREQEALGARTLELDRSRTELEGARRELVRRAHLAKLGELSAIIAHEVRNPLAIIKNGVSGLRRRWLDEEDRATLLGILDEEAGRLGHLVTDLLVFAQPVRPERQLSSLRDVIEGAWQAASAQMDPYGRVVFTAVAASDMPAIRCDPSLIRHALVNLFENALQAMPEGGRLAVTTEPDASGEFVEVKVSDTGAGMDESEVARAREPFFTTRPAGTGLGLAIVERVVAAHGGSLEIRSRKGAGTEIMLFLPRTTQSSIPPPAL